MPSSAALQCCYQDRAVLARSAVVPPPPAAKVVFTLTQRRGGDGGPEPIMRRLTGIMNHETSTTVRFQGGHWVILNIRLKVNLPVRTALMSPMTTGSVAFGTRTEV